MLYSLSLGWSRKWLFSVKWLPSNSYFLYCSYICIVIWVSENLLKIFFLGTLLLKYLFIKRQMVKQAVWPITGSRQVSEDVDSSLQSTVPPKLQVKFCGLLQLEEEKQKRPSRVLAYSIKLLSFIALIPGVLRSLPAHIYLGHLSLSSYCWGLCCLVFPTNPTYRLKKWSKVKPLRAFEFWLNWYMPLLWASLTLSEGQ